MADNELVEAVAQEVMLWHRTYEGEGTYWVWRSEKGWIAAISDWNPLEDWNDCWMVVEKMKEKGFEWLFYSVSKDGYYAEFGTYENRHAGVYEDNEARRAMINAALEAVSGK